MVHESDSYAVELGYNVIKKDWIFCVVISEEYNVTVNSEELIGTTAYHDIDEVTHKPMSL
jgi:hypothetical protein